MNKKNIEALFHYIPLHKTNMGIKTGRYFGSNNTEDISQRLLRLPLHCELVADEITHITSSIQDFFRNKKSAVGCN